MDSIQGNKITPLEFLSKYIGTREKEGNSGFYDAEFEKLMRSVGWLPGQSWCMYTCKLAYRESYGTKYSDVLNGSVHGSYKRIKNSPLYMIIEEPVPNCLMLYDTGKGRGHAGINKTMYKNGLYVLNVEGNTNVKGSREGELLMEKERNIAPVSPNFKLLGMAVPVL